MDRRFIAKKEFNLNRFIIYKKKNMNELIAKIKELNEAFMSDAALQIEKGNKAAGTRARKASLELEKLMKEFRKASLEASKEVRKKAYLMLRKTATTGGSFCF